MFCSSQRQPGCELILKQFNTFISTLGKGEKGEEQNLQRLVGITETTADLKS